MNHLRMALGLIFMPRSGARCLARSRLFSQSLAQPGPRVLPVSVGDGARNPPASPASSTDSPPKRCRCATFAAAASSAANRVRSSSSERTRSGSSARQPSGRAARPAPALRRASGACGPARGSPGCAASPRPQPRRSAPDPRNLRCRPAASRPRGPARSRLERVATCLRGHLRGGELPQLAVDKREQLRGGPAVSRMNSFDQAGHFRHE